MKHMGGAGKIFESFLDIIIFLYVSSSMCVYLYLYFDTSMSDKVRESMSGNVSSYPVEFGQILDWHEIMQILLVVANILVFFRILMFSALLDAVHEIVKAILKALSSMTTFLLLVLVRVFLCLSLRISLSNTERQVLVLITSFAGMYLFGDHSMDFKTFANAFSTQWKQIGGDTSVMSIVREFPVFAPMFVIVCFFMFNMIILNIGLAFFVEVWIRVVHERKSSNRERTRDFLRLSKHISELDKVYISLRDILFSYWINSDRLSRSYVERWCSQREAEISIISLYHVSTMSLK